MDNCKKTRSEYRSQVTILSLPIEIIYKIFTYFSIWDLKEANLVCKTWYEIIQHPLFTKKFIFRIPNNEMGFKLTRRSSNVIIHGPTTDLFNYLFSTRILFVEFRKCRLYGIDFFPFIKAVTSLKSLALYNCSLDYVPSEIEFLTKYGLINNIKYLKLRDITGDMKIQNLFETFMCAMPNIEKIDVNVQINLYNTGVEICEPGTQGIDYKRLIYHMKIFAVKLKHLKINLILDPDFIRQLADIDNLQLTALTVDKTTDALIVFLVRQPSITKLVLNEINSTHQCAIFSFITDRLTNLKTFISNARSSNVKIDDEQVENLSKLKNLEVLKLGLSNVDDTSLKNGLLKEENLKLKKLNIRDLSYNVIEEVTDNLPNLISLKIDCIGLRNSDMQLIWKNLKFLKELALTITADCRLTDYAFTGIPDTNNLEQGYSITHLRDLRSFTYDSYNKVLTNVFVLEISKINALIELHLSKVNIVSNDLLVLTNCKDLQNLYIEVFSNILEQDETKRKLRKSFPKFKYINIDRYCIHMYCDLKYDNYLGMKDPKYNSFQADDPPFSSDDEAD